MLIQVACLFVVGSNYFVRLTYIMASGNGSSFISSIKLHLELELFLELPFSFLAKDRR